jgi:hypothetical protein
MVRVVASSVNETQWQGSDGIITEGADNSQNNDGVGFKGAYTFVSCWLDTNTSFAAVFIRSLFEAYMRNAEYTNLRTLIRSYINVQVSRF